MSARTSLRVAAAGALALAACAKSTAKPVSVQSVPIERRDIVVDASATGTVEPINVVEVKSKSAGQIIRMPVETGTLVKAGDLLVELDARDVRNQYAQALAESRAAQQKLTVSAAQKKRADELRAQQVITATEHEAATLDYANAQAAVVSRRASLDLAKQRLEDATVRAPVAGTVIDKSVSLGQVISSATAGFGGGTTILKMADLNRVRIRALVGETDIGQVKPGQAATVTVDAYPDRPFRGVVEKIEPQAVVNQSVTQFPVLVTIENREGLLKPGMNGETAILVERREGAVAVPNDAVRTPREAAMTAPLLGLDADAVQRQVVAQTTASQRAAVARGDVGGSPPRMATPSPPAGSGPRAGPRAALVGARVDNARADNALVATEGAAPGRRARMGLVFVATTRGTTTTYEPRVVQLGLANYDVTEVLSGVKPGERVALLSASALQAQRQQQIERIRSFTGGGVPGMQRQTPQTATPAPAAPSGGPRGNAGGAMVRTRN
ncbi:MAG: hypothetical protein NVS9B3_05310 [Gemmatimonadaceae bacterium]